jgi:hypothetical protein
MVVNSQQEPTGEEGQSEKPEQPEQQDQPTD